MGRMEERHQVDLRGQQEHLGRVTAQLHAALASNERIEARCRELETRQREAVVDLQKTITYVRVRVHDSDH